MFLCKFRGNLTRKEERNNSKMTEEQQNLLTNEQISNILYRNTPCKGCIYVAFRLFVYVLLLVGIGDLLVAILVYTSTRTLDWYNGLYGFLGIVITFLAAFSYATRENVSGTGFYLFMLFLSFLGQLGVTLGILLYTYYPMLIGIQNAELVRYGMLSTAGVIFLAWIIGILYYCIIKKENEKRNLYFMLYGEPQDDLQPIVGVDLWRKYERTMIRWNRLFG
jgi:hypothetical protein